jgi:succinoglycan biosynthesis transport protein ExoP
LGGYQLLKHSHRLRSAHALVTRFLRKSKMQNLKEVEGVLVPSGPNKPPLAGKSIPLSQESATHQTIAKARYWHILQRRKTFICCACVFGGVLGFALTLLEVRAYQAQTTIEIEAQDDAFPTLSNYGKPGEGGTDIQTQISILKSRSLLKRVVAKLGSSTADSGKQAGVLPRFTLAMHGGQPDMTSAIALAVRSIDVRPNPGTRVIEISIDSTIPEVAANFANTLVNEFTEQNIDAKWQESLRRAEWLSRQMDEMRVKMDESESRLQQYARDAGIVFTDDRTSVSEERLSQVQAALSAAKADRIDKESKLRMLSSGSADSLPDVVDDDSIRGYQDKMAELRRQIAEMSVIYTPENIKIESLRVQIAAMENSYRLTREMIGAKIRNEYEESLRRERMLKADYVDQTTIVLGEGAKTLHYNVLKSEVDSNRQFYDTMLQQLKQSTIASAMRASNIHTVDPAEVPKMPYKPNIANSVATGGILGLFGAVGLVLLRERSNQTIRDIGETAEFLGIPELGVIPSAKMVAGYAKKDRSLRVRFIMPLTEVLPERIELATFQLQTSAVAESFRSTLVSILLSNYDMRKAHRFVITSASPGEGKTTVVCNLALAMAEMGDRVLIVDADLRKPRLHSVFGFDAQPGLSDLFTELADRNGMLDIAKYLRPTSVPRLFILTAGKATTAPTSLLYGKLLRELLELIEPGFDRILIDTPPMLEIPDARVVAKHADSVVLVVRAGKTTRDSAVAAYNQFLDDGTELLGAVVNDWSPADSSAGYYGYGYHYYGRQYATYPYGMKKDDQVVIPQPPPKNASL